MPASVIVFLGALLATHPTLVLGSSSLSASGPPACATITVTTGSSCPTITGFCARPQCLELRTVTLECGCPSIFSTTICPTACPRGCGITYDTVYLPCATSLASPPPITTTISSTSSVSSSSSVQSPPPTSPPSTSTVYPNSTMTSTSSSIVTITSCPESVTCTGQTTTWTGTSGPSSCPASSACSCVLPGGPQTASESTITITTPGKTGPTPTASASGSTPPLQANEGSRYGFGVVEGGVLVGLIGAVLGMM